VAIYYCVGLVLVVLVLAWGRLRLKEVEVLSFKDNPMHETKFVHYGQGLGPGEVWEKEFFLRDAIPYYEVATDTSRVVVPTRGWVTAARAVVRNGLSSDIEVKVSNAATLERLEPCRVSYRNVSSSYREFDALVTLAEFER